MWLCQKITQRFCANSTPLMWESLREQISVVWKCEATEATQACKQRFWLPLWLSVSLTALLIHLTHNRQQTHTTPSNQFITKNIWFQVSPCYYKKIKTFEVKVTEIVRFRCADIKGKNIIPGSSGRGCGLCNFSRCLLPSLFSLSLLSITLTKASHTHIHPLHQCDRQGDKMAE